MADSSLITVGLLKTFYKSITDIFANANTVTTELGKKVPTSRTVNGKALSSNITLTAANVGADASGSASQALTDAKSYTDSKIADLVNSAPETLDTLGEIATALAENDSVISAINEAIGKKAAASDLTDHISDTTVHITSSERTNWNAAYTAFSKLGITYDSSTDTVSIGQA
jgi:hypothetical protein